MKKHLVIVQLFAGCLLSFNAFAAWTTNTALNTPVTKATNVQFSPKMVTDGQFGSIVVWEDFRTNTHVDVYAQRIDASGNALWTLHGIPICVATGDQTDLRVVEDGQGGAIIVWQDERNGSSTDIYAQRVNGSGVVQWTTNGVAICAAADEQLLPTILSDFAGGAIITWYDKRNANYDIYAQKIDASGTVVWAADGVAVCSATGDQETPELCSDNAGGAIITWSDGRVASDFQIYAQRINTTGSVQWTTNGVPVCTAIDLQLTPIIVSDESGGAIIAWFDDRLGTYEGDLYAQRLNALGVSQWTTNGVVVCNAASFVGNPMILSDYSGGAFLTWSDARDMNGGDIYVQYISGAGVSQWTANGVPVCLAAGNQLVPKLITDVNGGIIVTWQDKRGSTFDIYAQAVNSLGVVQWTANGVVIGNAGSDQTWPQIVSDDMGGALISFYDQRLGGGDIYIQNVCSLGEVGYGIPAVPGVISGQLSVCVNSVNTYSVAPVSGATEYSWILPSGWTGTSTTNTITVTSSTNGGNLRVRSKNPCYTSPLRTLAITILDPPNSPAVIEGEVSICAGSVNTYSVSALSTASSYTWSLPSGWTGSSATNSINAASGVLSGTVSVVAANACGSSAATTLSVQTNALPTVDLGNNVTQCGGSVVLDATSPSATYTWSTGATSQSINVTTSNTYAVTLTDINSCSATDAVTITINALPNVSTSSTGASITATLGGATYQWMDCNSMQPILNEINQSYTAIANGSYAVIITLNSCTDTSSCVAINNVAIEEKKFNEQVLIFRDINSENIFIRTPVDGNFVLLNEIGQTVLKFDIGAHTEYTLYTAPLAKGIYFLLGSHSNKKLSRTKLNVW